MAFVTKKTPSAISKVKKMHVLFRTLKFKYFTFKRLFSLHYIFSSCTGKIREFKMPCSGVSGFRKSNISSLIT